MKFLKRLRNFLFLPITPGMAARIARRRCLRRQPLSLLGFFQVLPRKPARSAIYNEPQEPAWYVYRPWGDGADGRMIRSSRVVMVSKRTGGVLYDGSAHDQG